VAGERLPVEDEGLGGHQQLPQLGIQVLHLHNTFCTQYIVYRY
jgi:hypothetical protein